MNENTYGDMPMPFIEVQGGQLYYEVHGPPALPSHPPLLLIAGLGFATWSWFKQLPTLAQHTQVIVFDNRSTGQSQKLGYPYTIATLADDAAELLAALQIPRAHVLGTSFGGFIAQELALDHPERVATLMLCSTSYGGPQGIPMAGPVLQAPLGWSTPNQAIQRSLELATAPSYRAAHPDEFAQIVTWRQQDPQGYSDTFLQTMAGVSFDSAQRVHAIAAPTLVIHGADDQVVPVASARLLAQAIPNAELRIIPDAGHLVWIERAEEVNQAIVDFSLDAPPVP
jgi:pimeloyl-ACP methyl ester carboxylesterase